MGYCGYSRMRRQAQELAFGCSSNFLITGTVRTTRAASGLLTHPMSPVRRATPGARTPPAFPRSRKRARYQSLYSGFALLRFGSGGATMTGARQLATAAGLRMRLGGLMVPGIGPYQETIVCCPRGRRQLRGSRTRAAAPSGRRVHRRRARRVRPARFLWLAAEALLLSCGARPPVDRQVSHRVPARATSVRPARDQQGRCWRRYQVAGATLDAGRAGEMIRLHPRGLRAIRPREVRRSVASGLWAGTEIRRG